MNPVNLTKPGIEPEPLRNAGLHQLDDPGRRGLGILGRHEVEVAVALRPGEVGDGAPVDPVGGGDDPAPGRLAEHLGQPHHRHRARGDDVGQHLARPHRPAQPGILLAQHVDRRLLAPRSPEIFNRPYKTLGVEKGDERTVSEVDHKEGTVRLADKKGRTVDWRPYLLAGAKGGVEVCRSEAMGLRAGDRIRWTRNDPGSGLVNGQMAEVETIEKDGVRFRLHNGESVKLAEGDPQLRHLDHGWASTVHAFQGRTVDNIIAAMEAGHPHLTTRKAFYVAISRARDGAELVTDDAKQLADHLEKATGERVSALNAAKKYVTLGIEIGEGKTLEPGKVREREGREAGDPVREAERSNEPAHQTGPEIVPEPKQKSVDMDLGM